MAMPDQTKQRRAAGGREPGGLQHGVELRGLLAQLVARLVRPSIILERDATVRTGKPVSLSRAYINARNLQLSAYEALARATLGAGSHNVKEIDFGEGGYFQWASQLVDRFGVVPEHVMRDFSDSKSSATVIKLLDTAVSNAQVKLANAKTPVEVKGILAQASAEVDRTIARAFTGRDSLPTEFIVDGVKYSPKSYAAHLGLKSTDYVTLAASSSAEEGWNAEGPKIGPHAVRTYNTKDVETMKAAVRNAIDQGKKVYIFKFKSKKNYRKKQGHRQPYTQVEITAINA